MPVTGPHCWLRLDSLHLAPRRVRAAANLTRTVLHLVPLDPLQLVLEFIGRAGWPTTPGRHRSRSVFSTHPRLRETKESLRNRARNVDKGCDTHHALPGVRIALASLVGWGNLNPTFYPKHTVLVCLTFRVSGAAGVRCTRLLCVLGRTIRALGQYPMPRLAVSTATAG